ncbi:MAG: FecR domain-containing protein [Phycisphaerae bacterium]|jgi:hypothetical protein|nr:FecR domain-containing protein [Phycisphaerae bacterium]
MLRYTIIIGAVVILSAAPILAQAKAPADEKPAAAKADKPVTEKPADKAPAKKNAEKSGKLTVTVASVSGIAEQRSATDEKAKWTPVKTGDVLDEMTLVRTGLGGKVVLKFSDRGNVTIKSGSKIGIASFRKQGKLVKTRLGLKYGVIRAQVDSSRGANDFRVRTAVGTLAARGTGGHIAQWGDFSFQAKGTGGTWQTRVADRVTSLIAGEWTDKNLSQPLAALLAKHDPKVGDPHGGLTVAELKNLLVNGGGRGIVGFVGNAKNSGSPRLVNTPGSHVNVNNAGNQLGGGPVGGGPGPVGGGNPDRYRDDPERRDPR